MLNLLWIGFFLIAFVTAIVQLLLFNNINIFQQLMDSVFAMSKLSVDISIGLVGALSFWLGIVKIAEHCGLVEKLSKALSPLFVKLMPEVPSGHPAFGAITLNLSANVLGLDNAATPMGIKAMKELQTLNPEKETATNAQILFLVLNTSSVTLFPIAVFLYRAQQGAASPTDVFIPILLATSASTLAGLLVVSWVQKINLLQKTVIFYFMAAFVLLASLVLYFANLSAQALSDKSSLMASFLLLAFICGVLLVAKLRSVNAYDAFIEGAKEGFQLAISLIPYLIAMLVAIGLLRASGVIGGIASGIEWLVSIFGADTRFVDGLSTAFMKPFSGSGARAMMIETMNTHGVDSFPARLAAVFQGSTETTFYVLAVYFGSVGIKRTRHAIGCGLFADLAGIVTAIAVAYWFWG